MFFNVPIPFPFGWCLYGVAWSALRALVHFTTSWPMPGPRFLDLMPFDYCLLAWHIRTFLFFPLFFLSFIFGPFFFSCMGGLNGLSYIHPPYTSYLIPHFLPLSYHEYLSCLLTYLVVRCSAGEGGDSLCGLNCIISA
jgi:hypothetical protein